MLLYVSFRLFVLQINFSSQQKMYFLYTKVDDKEDCHNFKLLKKKQLGNNVQIEWSYSRKLNTCDPGDYVIEEGTTHIIWASGRGPLNDISGVNISDTLHGMSR